MRALFVINNPVYGGAHSELLAQRDGLAAAGFQIVALTPDEPGSGRDMLVESGVETVSIPLHRLRATWNPRPNLAFASTFWSEVRALRRVIRDRAIDLVQVHGAIHPHGAIAAHREGVAVCWHIYDMVAPLPLRRAMMPLVRVCADSATVIGRALVAAHPGAEALGERLVVTSPAVDLDRFGHSDAVRAAARRELGIPDDAVAVGTVGNRFPNKGHLDLIEAVSRIGESQPKVVTRILGAPSPAHGDYETKLRAAIAGAGDAGRIRLIDPRDRVAQLLPALDVFVLTSRAEGMPVSVFEAMRCGIPVIATDVGAVHEQVVDGMTGLLVPARDVDALVVALNRLVGESALRARFGAAGRDRVLAEFALDGVLAKRLRAYRIALEHRAARRSNGQRLRIRRRPDERSRTAR